MAFHLKTLWSFVGDLSGGPDSLSYVNLPLISLEPGHLAALALLGGGGGSRKLGLATKGKSGSAAAWRAEAWAQGLPELKAVSSPRSSTSESNVKPIKNYPTSTCPFLNSSPTQ